MDYTISGKVIKGDAYGRKIGFPTVNLDIGKQELPKAGVYAGFAVLDKKEFRAGIVVANNKVEAHLIGYEGDAYGKTVTLKLVKFLREYKKFDSEQELIIQIIKDLKLC